MLLLTRHIGQSIIIDLPSGEAITVSVVSVSGTQVKIGIDAPKSIPVNREEVHEKLKQHGERFTTKGHSIHEN